MKHLMWSMVMLLLAALPAGAQPDHPRGPGGGPGMPRLDRLELTDTQQKQIDGLRLEHQKKMIQLRSKIEETRLDLRAARKSATPDRAAVEKTIRSVSDLELQAKLERTKFWFDVRALLTSKQQETWKEMPGKGPLHRHGPPPGCRMERRG